MTMTGKEVKGLFWLELLFAFMIVILRPWKVQRPCHLC